MAEKEKKKRRGLGLLPKLLVGIFIPILIMFFFFWTLFFRSLNYGGNRFTSVQDIGGETLRELSTVSLMEAKSSLNRLGEKVIKQKAVDVAGQIEIFVKLHPKKGGSLERPVAQDHLRSKAWRDRLHRRP